MTIISKQIFFYKLSRQHYLDPIQKPITDARDKPLTVDERTQMLLPVGNKSYSITTATADIPLDRVLGI
jgi:hypothetical protein